MSRAGSPSTYRDSGVDVAAAARFVSAIEPLVRSTHSDAVVIHPSGFAGLIRPESRGMKDLLIAATCDGVGTKLLLARQIADYEALGRDLVAMNVNDLLPLGARPLLFLDYLATGKLDPPRLDAVVRGVVAACREAGCALLGGETAEMPGVYAPGGFDLAGFAVGLVDGDRLPDPETLAPGDAVLALPSTGLHANGFSLARRALLDAGRLTLDTEVPELGHTVGVELLTPTAIYVDRVLRLMEAVPVKAAAHVTGGGLLGRAAALVGDGMTVEIDPEAYPRPPIFELIRSLGRVAWTEMAATFNMGLGFLAVVPEENAVPAAVLGWPRVGTITEGPGKAQLGYAHR